MIFFYPQWWKHCLDLIFYRLGYVPKWELDDCREWGNFYADKWMEAEHEPTFPNRRYRLRI